MPCVFCEIVSGEKPADILYENKGAIAFYGLHFSAPAHAIIIPKKHIENVLDIVSGDSDAIFYTHLAIKEVAKILNIDNDGFRVITNTGKHGQQEVYHLHYHLIGGRQLNWEM